MKRQANTVPIILEKLKETDGAIVRLMEERKQAYQIALDARTRETTIMNEISALEQEVNGLKDELMEALRKGA